MGLLIFVFHFRKFTALRGSAIWDYWNVSYLEIRLIHRFIYKSQESSLSSQLMKCFPYWSIPMGNLYEVKGLFWIQTRHHLVYILLIWDCFIVKIRHVPHNVFILIFFRSERGNWEFFAVRNLCFRCLPSLHELYAIKNFICFLLTLEVNPDKLHSTLPTGDKS